METNQSAIDGETRNADSVQYPRLTVEDCRLKIILDGMYIEKVREEGLERLKKNRGKSIDRDPR